MQAIGKVDAVLHPGEGLCDGCGILKGYPRQSREIGEGFGALGGREPIDAAQHPFGLQMTVVQTKTSSWSIRLRARAPCRASSPTR